MTIEEYENLDVFWKNHTSMPRDMRAYKTYGEWKKVSEPIEKLWMNEREHFRLEYKQLRISNALETLKARGITSARLANFDNACITAISKSGKRMTYYAGTGTIAGYGYTPIRGIDKFIELLNSI